MPFPLLVSGGDEGRSGASWGNRSNSVELVVLPGGAPSSRDVEQLSAGGREEIVVGEEKLFPSSLLDYLAGLQITLM
uniref:Uncharacterized protein n=2 Tax=Macaca TaxID=9539 RepID=A0A2K6AY55_MACNE|nr:unnamed protein product [Macaca fascicularis]